MNKDVNCAPGEVKVNNLTISWWKPSSLWFVSVSFPQGKDVSGWEWSTFFNPEADDPRSVRAAALFYAASAISNRKEACFKHIEDLETAVSAVAADCA